MESSVKKFRSIAIVIVGWLLVLIGIAALILPGPGLLALFAGLTILSTRYEWAERRLKPVRKAALKAAHDGVANPARISGSMIGVLTLLSLGILWWLQPAAPSWWTLDDKYWLIGGKGAGITLMISGLIAGAMLVYSFIRFRKVD